MFIANFCIAICSLAFYIFLVGIYFSKKNMDNIENKVYKQLLLWNLGVLLGELLQLALASEFHNVFVAQVLNASYYIPSTIWIFFLSYYIILIAYEHNEKVINFCKNRKVTISIIIFLVIFSIIQIFLPTNIIEENNEFVAIGLGPSFIFANLLDAFFLLIGIIIIIINRKNINKKKIFPFKILVVLGIIIEIVSLNMPLTLTTIFMTLTSYLMYHTIENPDVQIINELTLAKQQTEKALNAKSDFLASMSHELRTPLNAIVGLSQMIDLNDNLDEIHTDNKDILISSGKLLDIVDSILDLNKIDSKDIEIVEVQYNPTDVFNKIVDKLSIRLTEKPIELKTNYVGLPTTLYGDIDKIKTIINNLLSNSIKYTDSGYINFNVEYTDKEKLIITVSDTGRGISEEQKSKLFDRFSRREEDKDSDISGTGIGLALTKSLVDVLDGKIEVTSNVGEGSTFTVVVNQKS